MNSNIQYQRAVPADYSALTALLTKSNLPVKDIQKDLPHFILAKNKEELIGSIGIEKYGTIGLLRSLSTDALFQQQGIASHLLEELLALCQSEGIQSVYLLTETAKSFFEKRGFAITERSAAPDPIKNSSEFSELCPSTALLMKKEI